MGNIFVFPWGKPAATESCLPTYAACLVFKCFHNSQNSDMDYRICNVCTDVNACGCTQGCTNAIRESALKVDFGRKKTLPTRELNLPLWCASLTLYYLSYIPTPLMWEMAAFEMEEISGRFLVTFGSLLMKTVRKV